MPGRTGLRDAPRCAGRGTAGILVDMNDTAGTRPPGTDGQPEFEGTFKDFWEGRPRRPRHGRKLAGVAAGVGYRYGVDPVLIRVVLVVTTVLGGAGALFYLLGWLFLPAEQDDVSPIEGLLGRGRSGASRLFTILLCVAVIPVFRWTFGGSWFDAGGLIGFGLLTMSVYLLHSNRGHHNGFVPGADRADSGASSLAGAPASFTHDDLDNSTQQEPSEWDPLAAAPLGWSLPDRATERPFAPPEEPPSGAAPPARRRRSRVGLVTFALALVVAGIGAAFNAAGSPDRFGWGWFTVPHVIGLVVAVLGAGLVVSTFLGGARRLIILALPLSLLGIVLTVVPVNMVRGGIGTVTHVPKTASELRSSYDHGVGELTVDLTQLRGEDPAVVDAQIGAGDVTVLVPDGANVDYTCTTGIGEVDCFHTYDSGVNPADLHGSEKGAGKQRFTLNVTAGMGNVEVRSE